MYYISEFCRVCLQYEKPLVDIMKKEAEPETLINKLKLCVSEVEWSTNESILMCQACIEKLNSAFEFKRQCLQSAQALENYISQLIGSEDSDVNRVGTKVYVSVSRNEVNQELVDEYIKMQKEEEESQKPTAFIRVKSNQQLYPQIPNIILTANNTNQNAFQNIFLNLIPSNTIKYPPSNLAFMNRVTNANVKPPPPPSHVKDANQNMFLNINNTLHKIFPIVSHGKEGKPSPPIPHPPVPHIPQRTPEDVNISRILTESKTEELSVEIDPMCFECTPEDEPSTVDENNDIAKDWEELISSNKIGPETLTKNSAKPKLVPNIPVPALTKLAEVNTHRYSSSNIRNNVDYSHHIIPNRFDKSYPPPPLNSYIPIRPKAKKDYITAELEAKMMDFLNVDHFMAPKEKIDRFTGDIGSKSLMCEQCGQMCDTLKALRYHIKQFHLGKFPYKCRYCSSVYALRAQYESHMQKHVMHTTDAFSKDTITLEDLSTQNEAILFPKSVVPEPVKPNINSNSELTESMEENTVQLEHKCEMCPRSFNSPHGLSRHKVRKHNQQTRRKYFVKGMKNAKCDICNREFSTQSYLQLHIKLHYRKNDYRLKVFNKDKYEQEQKEQESKNEASENNSEGGEKHETQKTHEKVDTFEETNSKAEAGSEEKVNSEPALPETEAKAEEEEKPETKNDTQPASEKQDLEEPKPLKGIKIKINLRNLKQTKTEVDKAKSFPEPNSDKTVKESLTKNNMNDSVNETPMDVDHSKEETYINGDLENEKETYNNDGTHAMDEDRTLSDLSEASPNTNMDCEESREILSPNAELSEETESLKDEGSPIGRRPPIKIVLVDGKSQCTFCYKLFAKKHELKRHMNNAHLKAIQYKCHLCDSQFYEAFHLTRHLRQHNSFVRCVGCQKEFSVLRDLKLHIGSAHKGAAPCQCGTCNQVYQRAKHLREHMREHDESIAYKCSTCGDEFKDSRDFTKHLVGHSGLHACNVCQTTYATEQELDAHSRFHAGDASEKRYECEVCHSKFKKKRYLLAHMNNHHSADKYGVDVDINRVESDYDSS